MAKQYFYFPFYVDNWIGSESVAAMSPEERGAYIQLLCFAWKAPDCGLPDDDNILARLSGLNERWLNGRSTVVKRQFDKDPQTGRLHNQFQIEVRSKIKLKSELAAIAGRISGEHRRLKNMTDGTDVERPFNERPTEHEPSKSKSKSKEKLNTLEQNSTEHPAMFEFFWHEYPRRIAKAAALKVWNKRNLDDKADAVMAHLAVCREEWTDEKYTPHPATWLNREDFDEITQRPGNGKEPYMTEDEFRSAHPELAGQDIPLLYHQAKLAYYEGGID